MHGPLLLTSDVWCMFGRKRCTQVVGRQKVRVKGGFKLNHLSSVFALGWLRSLDIGVALKLTDLGMVQYIKTGEAQIGKCCHDTDHPVLAGNDNISKKTNVFNDSIPRWSQADAPAGGRLSLYSAQWGRNWKSLEVGVVGRCVPVIYIYTYIYTYTPCIYHAIDLDVNFRVHPSRWIGFLKPWEQPTWT